MAANVFVLRDHVSGWRFFDNFITLQTVSLRLNFMVIDRYCGSANRFLNVSSSSLLKIELGFSKNWIFFTEARLAHAQPIVGRFGVSVRGHIRYEYKNIR